MIESIQEIYNLIDKSDSDPDVSLDSGMVKLFKKLRDNPAIQKHPGIIKHCQIEIDLQNFQITDGILHPIFTSTNAEGVYFEYPSLKNYTEEDLEYIAGRQKKTKNPALKLRYSHLLWLSPRKHNDWAVAAILLYKS